MAMTADKPLDWIREVERLLLNLEEKPQFGLPAPFDWKVFEKRLQEVLGHGLLKTGYDIKGWEVGGKIWSGLGKGLMCLPIEWVPLTLPVYFLTNGQDLKQLMRNLLGEKKETAYFYDPSLVEGFYYYFIAEILSILENLNFASPLSPRLGEVCEDIQQVIGEQPCFVINIFCSLNQQPFRAKLLLTADFRREWKSYFSHLLPSTLSCEVKEKINLDISLEIGHTRLKFKEWKNVKKGDFILLDHCSYDPVKKKGGVVLSLNQKSLFRGRFKERGIKITEYPNYQEVSTFMDEEPFFDMNQSEDFTSELEDENPSLKDLEDFDEEESMKKMELIPNETTIAIEELPIDLTVEVGRLRMTAKALMDLNPGNLIEINVHPEQGVDLVVNGKKVGRGELIRIGETLGVRILSL